MNLLINEFNSTKDVRDRAGNTVYTVYHLEQDKVLRMPMHVAFSPQKNQQAKLSVNQEDFSWLEPQVFLDSMHSWLKNKSASVSIACTDSADVESIVQKIEGAGSMTQRGLYMVLRCKIIDTVDGKTLVDVRQTNSLLFQALLDRVSDDFQASLTKTVQAELTIQLA